MFVQIVMPGPIHTCNSIINTNSLTNEMHTVGFLILCTHPIQLEHVIDIHLLCVTVKMRLHNFKITLNSDYVGIYVYVRCNVQAAYTYASIWRRDHGKKHTGGADLEKTMRKLLLNLFHFSSFCWWEVWADTTDDDQRQMAHWCFISLGGNFTLSVITTHIASDYENERKRSFGW